MLTGTRSSHTTKTHHQHTTRHKGGRVPLGNDLHQARLKWAELEREPLDTQDKTFAVIAERYRREVLNQKVQPLSISELRGGFDRAREKAGVSFQFRVLRAKAATDTKDLHHAQKLLGHTTRAITEQYTRKRIGDTVKPVGTKSK